jgi:hypothetical protein
MCAFQIIAKSFSTALLLVTNGTWLLAYMLADHGLHLAWKFAQRDFFDSAPTSAAASYVIAPIIRTITKVITDFTGCPVTRLPLVQGGTSWLTSLVTSQVSVFVSVYLYNEYAGQSAAKLSPRLLWTGASALSAAWLVSFLYFVRRFAVPRLRYTLWSSTSGRQYLVGLFENGKTDQERFLIFGFNRLKWEADIGDEVRAWVAENLDRWKEDAAGQGEAGKWFEVEKIPDGFLPKEELVALGPNRRRRGSAVESMRESFRESTREEDPGEEGGA